MTDEHRVSVAAATAVVGYNLINAEDWRVDTSKNRWLSQVALVGSTNPADSEVELWVGRLPRSKYANTTGGANLEPDDTDRKFPRTFIPKNAEIKFVVTDAPVGNALVLAVKFDNVKSSYNRNYSSSNSGQKPWRATSKYPTRASWVAAGSPRRMR